MAKYIVSEVKSITRSAKKIVIKPNITAHRKLLIQESKLYEKISSLEGDLNEATLHPLIEKDGISHK